MKQPKRDNMKQFIVVAIAAALLAGCHENFSKNETFEEGVVTIIPAANYKISDSLPHKVENAEAAIKAASYYGFVPDSALNANTYYRKGSNYVLRLTNHNMMPDAFYTDEVVEVTVTKDGYIKTRSVWQRKADPKRFSR